MKRITPVLIVDAIEPCLEFWVERLGFQKTVEVPHRDALGFVILKRGGLEIMYQTRASLEAEEYFPHGATQGVGRAVLYIEVADLDALRERLQGYELLVPGRETFYGAREIWLREPGGHLLGFAALKT